MNSPQIPKGTPVKDEDKIYFDLLKEIEKTQINTLDESGKRLIDRSAATLGVFMTIIALSKDFPLPYLISNPIRVPLAIAILILVILSQLSGFLLLLPRKYKFFQYNLNENEKEYKKIKEIKVWFSNLGSSSFFIAMVLLAILLGSIILDL